MSTTTEIVTERYILKCRRCKHLLVRNFEVKVTRVDGRTQYGRSCYSTHRQVVGTAFDHPRVVCPRCGDYNRDGERSIMAATKVDGHFSPEHKCDPRCTGARGPHCDCQCGGANYEG